MSGGCWPAASSRRDVHDAPKTAPVWPRVSGRGLGRPGRVGHRSVDLACGVDGCNRRVPRSARHPGTLQALVAVTGILPASLLGVAAGGIYGFVSGSPGFYRLWFVMMLPACIGSCGRGGTLGRRAALFIFPYREACQDPFATSASAIVIAGIHLRTICRFASRDIHA